jgi:predicted AAA+ superfamily ATPase
MIIIRNVESLPRSLTAALERVLEVMPVAVVTGARQTGKSTLARELLQSGHRYLTLDDFDVRAQAERFPHELVRRADQLVLDEVQRVPDLLLAVKQAVDERRVAGRFVLTGSANLLLMRTVADSLAGRASYLTLWPLSRREQLGQGRSGLWAELFEWPVSEWLERLAAASTQPTDWRELALRGGYPVPALTLASAEDRAIWFDGYVGTYLERDLQDLAAIDNLVDFRRLMQAVCHRIGQLLNQSELGRDVQLPQPTVHRWLNLLETSYLLVRLPAYAVNRTKRLIKTPKPYWSDTGLALHLTGEATPRGAHLENLVLSDLLAWRDAQPAHRPGLFYWRTAGGEEVDFVIEHRGGLVAVEVKAATRVGASDIGHLRSFQAEYGPLRGSLLLHAGEAAEWLAPGVLAVPWWYVL